MQTPHKRSHMNHSSDTGCVHLLILPSPLVAGEWGGEALDMISFSRSDLLPDKPITRLAKPELILTVPDPADHYRFPSVVLVRTWWGQVRHGHFSSSTRHPSALAIGGWRWRSPLHNKILTPFLYDVDISEQSPHPPPVGPVRWSRRTW